MFIDVATKMLGRKGLGVARCCRKVRYSETLTGWFLLSKISLLTVDSFIHSTNNGWVSTNARHCSRSGSSLSWRFHIDDALMADLSCPLSESYSLIKPLSFFCSFPCYLRPPKTTQFISFIHYFTFSLQKSRSFRTRSCLTQSCFSNPQNNSCTQ